MYKYIQISKSETNFVTMMQHTKTLPICLLVVLQNKSNISKIFQKYKCDLQLAVTLQKSHNLSFVITNIEWLLCFSVTLGDVKMLLAIY